MSLAILEPIQYFLVNVEDIATFVERKSRLTIVKQLNGKFKTLTDHGKEFADYRAIEKLTGTQVYFTYAYLPHERDSDKNRNWVLQRFIPKGKPIEELSDDKLI